jgi:hypothetical protein
MDAANGHTRSAIVMHDAHIAECQVLFLSGEFQVGANRIHVTDQSYGSCQARTEDGRAKAGKEFGDWNEFGFGARGLNRSVTREQGHSHIRARVRPTEVS